MNNNTFKELRTSLDKVMNIFEESEENAKVLISKKDTEIAKLRNDLQASNTKIEQLEVN